MNDRPSIPMTPPTAAEHADTPSLAALRRFVRSRPSLERCELCGAELAEDHAHLLELPQRQLLCACDACAILLAGQEGKYRRIPRDIHFLPRFHMSEIQWAALGVPIRLAFFFYDTAAGGTVAVYPSPAGPTRAAVDAEAWRDLLADNPALARLQPDVEALLVNRIGDAREHYRLPIDQCYRLVGLIRTHWRGMSGGAELWERVNGFLADLKRRSGPAGKERHA